MDYLTMILVVDTLDFHRDLNLKFDFIMVQQDNTEER